MIGPVRSLAHVFVGALTEDANDTRPIVSHFPSLDQRAAFSFSVRVSALPE